MTDRRIRLAAPLCAIALLVTLSACGRDRAEPEAPTTTAAPTSVPPTTVGPASTPPTTTSAPTSAPPTTSAGPAPECPPGPASTDGSRVGIGSGTVLLNGLVSNHSDCVDAVFFTFRGVDGAKPGWRTDWVEPPFVEDPSGRTLPIKGAAFLRLRISPAYGYDFESGEQTYTGAARVEPPPGGRVQEVVRTGDFEGVLSFVIGLDSKRPFAVQTEGGKEAELTLVFGD